MKTFFTRNKKTLVSVGLGIMLALGLNMGQTMITDAALQIQALNAVPFNNSSNLASKIGSLTVGSVNPTGWLAGGLGSNQKCINDDPNFFFDSDSESCLSVIGFANVGKLFAKTPAALGSKLFINNTGSSSSASPENTVVVGNNGSILVSGLGNYNNTGSFQANDTTSKRNVCATSDGTLRTCPADGGPSPVNGACGLSHTGTFENAPTTRLCSSGTASTVTDNSGGTRNAGNHDYTWTCSGSNGGSVASCYADQTPADPNPEYAWDVSTYGACQGSSGGSCSGTPTGGQGAKIDWNGNPFEWIDGIVYKADNNGNPDNVTGCAGPNDNYDMSAGKNLDYNAAIGGQACIIQSPPYTWAQLLYEPSKATGKWEQLNVTPGTGGDRVNPGNNNTPGWINAVNNLNASPLYQQGQVLRSYCSYDGSTANAQQDCGPGGSVGIWVNMNNYCSPVSHTTIPTAPNYAGEEICYKSSGGSCNGTTQSSCTSVGGCNWTGGTTGTQTRTVQCKRIDVTPNQNVADSFCPSPKPSTQQSCN